MGESAKRRAEEVAPDGPSWIDLAAIRVNITESRVEASLNRLLQQNRPVADKAELAADVAFEFDDEGEELPGKHAAWQSEAARLVLVN
jgi:hypothetical protein